MMAAPPQTCSHTTWVTPPPDEHFITGELISTAPFQVNTYEDCGRGRYRCTQCSELGYYTGLWLRYYEDGIPCAGSDGEPRELPPDTHHGETHPQPTRDQG